MIRPRLGHISYAIALAITVFAGQALAQDQAAIEKLVQMNKKALDDYDTLEWESAKKTLLDALMAGKKAGLDNHPVMARTYVHLGAVYITGFKNRDKAIQSFSRALEIDPSIQLSRGIATQEVNDAFAEAKRNRGGGGGTSTPPPPPPAKKPRKGPVMEEGGEATPPPPPAKKKQAALSTSGDDEDEERDLPVKFKQPLECPNEDEAIIDKPATLRCAVAPGLPVAKMYLMYLEPKKEKYTELAMTKSKKGWWVGKIPKKTVTGTSVSYYFEGRDAAGNPKVRNGEESSPNHLLVMEEEDYIAAKNERNKDLGKDVENPLEKKKGPVEQSHLGRHRENVGEDVNFGNRKWWIGIGAGSGFGYAKGQGLEAVNRSPDPQFHALASEFLAGGAFAGLFHIAPEVGYQISPNVAISVEGRFQYIPQPAKYTHYAAHGALSGLLKLMRYTKQAQIRFFGTAIVGGGEGFRFTVYPVDPAVNMNLASVQDFKDTVRGGPVIAGAGVGMYYEASKRTAIVLESHGLAGFPIFSFVADVNLSLQINFYAKEKEAPPGQYVPKEEDEEPK